MTAVPDPDPTAVALLARLGGLSLDGDRLLAVIAAYAPIFEEIARLKSLDLQDVHPAVIFEPTAPYRSKR